MTVSHTWGKNNNKTKRRAKRVEQNSVHSTPRGLQCHDNTGSWIESLPPGGVQLVQNSVLQSVQVHSIVHFLSSEKTCSCTFEIPINKAFKMCLKGTKISHTLFWLVSLNRGIENVLKSRPWIISPSDRECRPLVRPVQGGTPTLIHNHARTHAHTHTHTHSLLGTGKPRTATLTFTQLLSSDLTAQKA